MIAATGSGSGKTLLTCALLQILKEQKKKTVSFKCGPDYIDPMFHQKILGIPSKNLDTYFTGEILTRSLFLEAVKNPDTVEDTDAVSAKCADIAVIEGVMGLYDGLGGVKKEGSSYHLAEVTDTPVILVVNAHGMGKSLLAVIQGFLDYDKKHLIRGVILNRTSKMFYEVIAPEIERECGVKALGFVPKLSDIRMESRHLGLVMPQELPNIRKEMETAARAVKENIDLNELYAIAARAKPLTAPAIEVRRAVREIPIAVAKDDAFCFYYEDNLKLLEKAGAKLVEFSPLQDRELPKGACGLLLGGGYPELFAGQLSQNTKMRQAVFDSVKSGMPVIAECGGFLYLHETLEDMNKDRYPMAGVIEGTAFYTGKLVRFGYIGIREKQPDFLPETEQILGHEFHYFDSTSNGDGCTAAKAVSKREWDCVHKNAFSWMGFPHLYYYSNPEYVYRFLEKAVSYGSRNED